MERRGFLRAGLAAFAVALVPRLFAERRSPWWSDPFDPMDGQQRVDVLSAFCACPLPDGWAPLAFLTACPRRRMLGAVVRHEGRMLELAFAVPFEHMPTRAQAVARLRRYAVEGIHRRSLQVALFAHRYG